MMATFWLFEDLEWLVLFKDSSDFIYVYLDSLELGFIHLSPCWHLGLNLAWWAVFSMTRP
jgi:hypothetical protein